MLPAVADDATEHALFDELYCGGEATTEEDHELGAMAAGVAGFLPPGAAARHVVSMIGVLRAHFVTVEDGGGDELGVVIAGGLYPRQAILNHSCAPNCRLLFDEGGRLSVAVSPHGGGIVSGEELTIAYVAPNEPRSSRQRLLMDGYGFVCTCPRCEMELEGEAC